MNLPLVLAAVITIGAPGKPVLEYRHENVPFKPYVAQLYTPAGVGVLRDNVPDHKHHHGLMFAIAADEVDFWAEFPTCGKQITRKIKSTDTGITQQLDWTAPDGKIILSEERTLIVHPGAVTLLTWQSRLNSKQEVKLTGNHYFGLGMRFVSSMDKIATFINSGNSTGTVVRGSEKVFPANWCAATGMIEGKPVTVALFDHPKNLRHPATMFTMNVPFAYMSATLNLWKEPFTLKQPLELRYGVALWDGKQTSEEVERVYKRWLTP